MFFLVTIAVESYFRWTYLAAINILIIYLVVSIIWLVLVGSVSIWGQFSVFVLIALGAILLFNFKLGQLPAFIPQLGWKKGYVYSQPHFKGSQLQFDFKSLSDKHLILVKSKAPPDFWVGQSLKLKCHLKVPEPFAGFDYQLYLAAKKIGSICDLVSWEELDQTAGWWQLIRTYLFKIRSSLVLGAKRVFVAPTAILFLGLFLGGKNSFSPQLSLMLRKVGLTHVVVASGYNVALIINFYLWIGPYIWFNRKQMAWFIYPTVILFVVLSGSESSVVRAAIMGLLAYFLQTNGRKSNVLVTLIQTAGMMVLLNPFILVYDIGWQLSMAATLGLIVFPSVVVQKIKPLNYLPGFWSEILVSTLAAYIFTLPIIWWHFGQISWLGILSNLLVLWVLPMMMLSGALALIFSLVIPDSLNIFIWLTELGLGYFFLVVRILS